LVDKYEALKEERLTPVLAGFSHEELRQLARLMERFSLRLLNSEGADDGLCFRCSAYYEENCPVNHLHDQCPYQRLRKPKEERAAAQEDRT
jgi:hypothetical protein